MAKSTAAAQITFCVLIGGGWSATAHTEALDVTAVGESIDEARSAVEAVLKIATELRESVH